jgi:outer membrane lipoprotein-sorting protein
VRPARRDHEGGIALRQTLPKPLAITALLLVALALPAPALAAERPPIEELVRMADRIFRSETSVASMEMTVETPEWSRTLTMEIWTEKLDQTFVRITAPAREAGTATLRIENEMWNYFPKINKVMKVPPSMMMSSWMGSDFTNDDLVKESSMLRDYTSRYVEPESLPEGDASPGHWYIELVPREDSPIVWGRIVIEIRHEDYIPTREDFYDEHGAKVRVMNLREIRPLGGRTIPTVMELIPLTKPGHRTLVRYTSATFDQPLPEDTFTHRNLQKRR